jgi:hypothetical protein
MHFAMVLAVAVIAPECVRHRSPSHAVLFVIPQDGSVPNRAERRIEADVQHVDVKI